MITANFSEEENLRDAAAAAALWRTVAECPRPVVARVHGNAFGGGAGLVAASDIAVAAESAMFGFTEVRLGLLPATVAPHAIEKIGPGRALPLFLTGERFDAERALRIGLVHHIAADVDDIVKLLMTSGPEAVRECKKLIAHVAAGDLTEAVPYTIEAIAARRVSEEGQAGMQAFLKKEKAPWLP